MTFGRPTLKQLRAQRVKQRRRNLKALATTPSRALGRAVYGGTTAAPAPKEDVLTSEAYRRAVRGLECMRCRSCNGTGEAHLPHGSDGRRLVNYMDASLHAGRDGLKRRLQAFEV